jgi:PAS domain-containing protein
MVPPFASVETLRLLEGFGLTGSWSWGFAENEHAWSPGLFRILGVPSGTVRADYRLLHSLIHPADRPSTMRPASIQHAGLLTEQTFRILRPDSTLRTVMSRGEIIVSPTGRPLRAHGVLIDVSDREALARAHAAQRRRERAIFEKVRAFTSTTAIYPFRTFSPEWLELVGLPEAELLDEPTRPVVATERRHWRDYGRECYQTHQIVHTMPTLTLANGETVPYRMVMIPVLDGQGTVEHWTNYIGPAGLPVRAAGPMLEGLEQRLEGHHIRAARALLDWSMADLSRASGLSFSTIRRLEGGGEALVPSSRHRAIAALRAAGILFSLVEGSTIVVGKPGAA